MESKVIRLSASTIESIEEFRNLLVEDEKNEIVKECFMNQSIDELIRITFQNKINELRKVITK